MTWAILSAAASAVAKGAVVAGKGAVVAGKAAASGVGAGADVASGLVGTAGNLLGKAGSGSMLGKAGTAIGKTAGAVGKTVSKAISPLEELAEVSTAIGEGGVQASGPTGLLADILKLAKEQAPQVAGQAGAAPTPAAGAAKSAGAAGTAAQTPTSILSDVAISTAKSAVKKQTESLLQQGVSPEKIIETSLGEGVRDTSRAVTRTPVATPEPKQPGLFGNTKTESVLNFLQNAITSQTGIPTPGSIKVERLQKQFEAGVRKGSESEIFARNLKKDLLLKTFEGGQKTQQEEVKTFNKRRDELFKAVRTPKSAEITKALGQTESSLTGIDNAVNILGISMDEQTGEAVIANAGELRNPLFLSKNRQTLKRARDVFINKQLRRDSGATITDADTKEFSKAFGFDIGMKAYLQNPDVIAKSLLESRAQLTRDRQRLAPNEKRVSEVRRLEELGFSDDEIAEAFQKVGDL